MERFEDKVYNRQKMRFACNMAKKSMVMVTNPNAVVINVEKTKE